MTPSIIKAPVNGGWATSGLVHFNDIVRGYNNSFRFVHGKVTEVSKNSLKIQKANGEASDLRFDYLVIATGAIYYSYIQDLSSVTFN